MNQKDSFITLLKELEPERWEELIPRFELLHRELMHWNEVMNLFSRQTDPQDLWTKHFLDSLLLLKLTPLQQETVLDFGTGGGLPGIPLKLVRPGLDMILLDATHKKIKALQEICRSMELNECQAVWSRIEDFSPAKKIGIVVCRSVKIIPEFVRPLQQILGKQGTLYLYKSQHWEDAALFGSYKVHDLSHEAIGTRTIIEIG